MHIVHVSAELSPFAKVGGLGDVVFGLSHELTSLGAKVSCILPFYHHLNYSCLKNLKVAGSTRFNQDNETPYEVRYWVGSLDSLEIILIESLHPRLFFKRGSIYGESDDALRFLHFCFLAHHSFDVLKLSFNCLHLHDWQASFLALYLKSTSESGSIKSILTIHNMMHQGITSLDHLKELPHHILRLLEQKECKDPNDDSSINLLRCGIEHCDILTTVSPTYAREIGTPDYGYHLYPIIKKHEKKLHGILNGIDEYYWSRTNDPFLKISFPKNNNYYQINEVKNHYKQLIKQQLNLHFPLDSPLFCSITRLDYQKSPESIIQAAKFCTSKHIPYVILGAPSTSEIDELILQTLEDLKEKHLFSYCRGFHEGFAHLLFAAADFIFIPSRFEPCGLTQMIGLRYGAIPIVRRTGGLVDSIVDFYQNSSEGTGIIFDELKERSIEDATEKAIRLYLDKPKLQQIRSHGMAQDFSWKKPAKIYLSLYEQMKKS